MLGSSRQNQRLGPQAAKPIRWHHCMSFSNPGLHLQDKSPASVLEVNASAHVQVQAQIQLALALVVLVSALVLKVYALASSVQQVQVLAPCAQALVEQMQM